MAGFENDVLLCSNVNFNPSLPKPHLGLITVDGQLITGSTALNAGGTHLNIGHLVSPLGTLTIGYNSPNITLDVTGGTYISLSPFIVGTDTHSGYSTIAAAIAAAVTAGATASNPQNVYIKPKADGTAYTENLTLAPGVNIAAIGCSSPLDNLGNGPSVKIIGKCSASFVGTCNISGIALQTNNDFCVEITGSNATSINFFNCYVIATNHTAIHHTGTTGNVVTNFYNCGGNILNTGIAFFTISGSNPVRIFGGYWNNNALSSTASTISSSSTTELAVYNAFFYNSITTTNNGVLTAAHSNFQLPIILNGTTGGDVLNNCSVTGSASSAISIGAGATLSMTNSSVNSSNTNALTGAGTLNYGSIVFSGSSSGHNVTTETPFAVSTPVSFQAYRTTNQTCTAGSTADTVIFDTAITNLGSGYNASNGIFTAPSTGFYSFSCTLFFGGVSVGTTQILSAYTGSVQSARLIQNTAGAAICTASWGMPMTAGDTVKIQPFTDGTGTYTIVGAALSSSAFNPPSLFSGFRIS